MGCYLHSSPSPALGKAAAAVALEPVDSEAAVEGSHVQKAQVCAVHFSGLHSSFAMASISSPVAAPVWTSDRSFQSVVCRGLQDLARKVAMHAVAMKPDFMDAAGVSPQALEGGKCACLLTAMREAMAGLLPGTNCLQTYRAPQALDPCKMQLHRAQPHRT